MSQTASRPAFGIYIHVPHCLSKCPYCDFYSQVGLPAAELVGALVAAIERAHELPVPTDALRPGRKVASVYFGGGTPSLLEPDQVARVIEAVRRRFALQPDAEVSLEVNPASAFVERAGDYRAAGVNRLSIGVQSLDDRCLKVLGRAHNAAAARRTIWAAQEAGFTAVGVDLMLGIPGQDLRASRDDVQAVSELGLEHISTYVLTLEVGTPMYSAAQAGRVRLVDEDRAAAQLEACCELLAASGFVRYEISNHARPGHRSRHNSNYWSGGEYLGIGPGAHSHFRRGDGGGLRFAELPDVAVWAKGVNQAGAARDEVQCYRVSGPAAESIEPRHYALERIYLGLRDLERGADLAGVQHDSGQQLWLELERCIEMLRKRGLVTVTEAMQLVLSPRGTQLADLVAAEILATPR